MEFRQPRIHCKGVEPLPRRGCWQRRMIPFHQQCICARVSGRHSRAEARSQCCADLFFKPGTQVVPRAAINGSALWKLK